MSLKQELADNIKDKHTYVINFVEAIYSNKLLNKIEKENIINNKLQYSSDVINVLKTLKQHKSLIKKWIGDIDIYIENIKEVIIDNISNSNFEYLITKEIKS